MVSLILAPKRSLLKREQILINVLKALASIISVCSLPGVLLFLHDAAIGTYRVENAVLSGYVM
jgi:hypothetical protein